MNCCICGGKIFNASKSNDPWPLCPENDSAARCCGTCNEDLVVKARIALYTLGGELEWNDISKILPYYSTIAIFWCSDCEKPLEHLGRTGKVMCGLVTAIDYDNGKIYGKWGNFAVDFIESNWVVLDKGVANGLNV